MVEGTNPYYRTKEKPTDIKYKVKRSFFGGVKKAGKSITKSAKASGKFLAKTGKAAGKGIVSAAETQSKFKKVYYEKRALGLERKQNIATYKANIAQQRLQKVQAKTVEKEAKLKQLELKRARRDFIRAEAVERNQTRTKPLSDKGFSGKVSSLSDRKQPKRKKPSFFD